MSRASGVAMLVIGVLEATDIHLPGVQMNGFSPIVPILLGPVLVVIGVLALAALRLYVRFLIRTLKRVLPRAHPEPTAA